MPTHLRGAGTVPVCDAAVLRETEAPLTGHRVRALVHDDRTTGPQTELVVATARAGAVPVVPVTETLPAGRDHASWMASDLARVRAPVAA